MLGTLKIIHMHGTKRVSLQHCLYSERERDGWLAQQVGAESQRTFHLFETKKTLIPALDESQQMRLGAWQQFSPNSASVNLQPIKAGVT